MTKNNGKLIIITEIKLFLPHTEINIITLFNKMQIIEYLSIFMNMSSLNFFLFDYSMNKLFLKFPIKRMHILYYYNTDESESLSNVLNVKELGDIKIDKKNSN